MWWNDSRSRNVFPCGQSHIGRDSKAECCILADLRVGQISRPWWKETNLPKVWSGRVLCPDWSVGTNGPSNHSRGKELELDWSMSGLVICNQGGHPWVLPKSYGKGWFFAVNWFSEHKRRGRFFYHSCFLGSQGSCKIQDCQKKEVVILKRVVGGGHTEKVTFEQRPKPEDIKDIREGTLGRKNSNAKPKELLGLICWRNTKEFSVAGEEWD